MHTVLPTCHSRHRTTSRWILIGIVHAYEAGNVCRYVLLGSTTAAGMTGGSYFTTTKQLVGRPGQPQGTVGGFVPFTKALTQNQMQIVFTWQTMSSEANKAGVQVSFCLDDCS